MHRNDMKTKNKRQIPVIVQKDRRKTKMLKLTVEAFPQPNVDCILSIIVVKLLTRSVGYL